MTYEQAQDMNSSPLWEAAQKELDKWIQAEMDKLCSCSPERLTVLQNTIACYKRCKELPAIVKGREEG